jgi:hypothetical protein
MRCTRFRVLAFVSVLGLLAAACGGGTVLGGLPRPNPTVMAGIAAAAATAATIADPGAAGRIYEEGRVKHLNRADGDSETIPLDVLDRLDDAEADADASGYSADPDPAAP